MGRPSVWIRATALFAAIFVAVALCPSASHGADPNDIYWIPDRNLYGTGLVDAVLTDGEDVYFGGSFDVRNTSVRDCAHWDGTTWTTLGGAVGTEQMGLVHVIVRSGEDFYIAGMFDEVSTIIPAKKNTSSESTPSRPPPETWVTAAKTNGPRMPPNFPLML